MAFVYPQPKHPTDLVVHRLRTRKRRAADLRDTRAMSYVYLLRCSDGSFYVGSARDLEQRVLQHAAGVVKGYTSTRRPVELVWALETERIDDAAALERQIKGWRRTKRLALIEGRLDDLPALSRAGSHAAGEL